MAALGNSNNTRRGTQHSSDGLQHRSKQCWRPCNGVNNKDTDTDIDTDRSVAGFKRRRRRSSSIGPLPYSYIVFLSCLLLRNLSDLRSGLGGQQQHQNEQQQQRQRFIPIAQAFVPPTENSSNSCGSRRRIGDKYLTKTKTTTATDTALYFFSIFSNSNSDGSPSNNNGYEKDFPLARYVDVSANYTLAHTPEDYIDLCENQRLVCVGDVHGDLEALRKFLETAGVYDRATDSWCGGNTIVVQCGDILDRGFEELACYQLLSKLSRQAPTQDGKVILLVGNHEALNAMGCFQYAFTDREHELMIGATVDSILGPENQWRKQYANNQPSRWASYEPGGLLAHSLLRNMKVAVRVGKTVCVHAGLTPEHLKDHGGIASMNAAFREWISLGDDVGLDRSAAANTNGGSSQQLSSSSSHVHQSPVVYNHHGNYPTPRQPWIDAEKRQQHYINSIPKFLQSTPENPGPIWMRDYSSPHDAPPNPSVSVKLERDLDTTLTLLDAHRMVMGHTIQSRINGIFRGKAWRLDVGASKGCLGGSPEVLEVVCRRSGPQGSLFEEVSILVPATATAPQQQQQQPQSLLQQHPLQQQQQQQQQEGPPFPMGHRVMATERLVDSYTQAALQML